MIYNPRRIAQKTLSVVLAALLFTSFPAISFAQSPATDSSPSASGSSTETVTPTAASAPVKNGSSEISADATPASQQSSMTVTSAEPTANLNTAPASSAPAPTIAIEATQPAASTVVSEKPPTNETPPLAATTSGPQQVTAATVAPTTQSVTVKNTTDSTAKSGDATVVENQKAGSATSGKADVNATVVNVVGTGSGFQNAPVTFVYNIVNPAGLQELQKDIMIDPNTLLALPSGTAAARINLAQNSVSLTDIENNIVLNAVSGNAAVLNNDEAGNAISGDAAALANVINIVSSSVGAERSFLGVINIYGDLRGDIRVPASFVNSLFASNALNNTASSPLGGTSLATPAGGIPSSTDTTVNITNNVNLSALSGTAAVSDNQQAGSATSGSATTNLTVFNLTGQEVIAKNSLLVFVNVLGKWVGIIIEAPAGSTTAAYSDGSGDVAIAGQAIAGSHQSVTNITNNVSVNATSGNATVSGNDKAGNATSGNALAGANILNLVHSSFNLDDWFGALFINVIGSWIGDFGIAGVEPTTTAPGQQPTPTPSSTSPPANTDAVQRVKVFRFNADTEFSPAPITDSSRPAQTDEDATLVTTSAPVSATNKLPGQVLGDADSPALSQQTLDLAGQDVLSIAAMIAGFALLAVLATAAFRRYRLAT